MSSERGHQGGRSIYEGFSEPRGGGTEFSNYQEGFHLAGVCRVTRARLAAFFSDPPPRGVPDLVAGIRSAFFFRFVPSCSNIPLFITNVRALCWALIWTVRIQNFY